MTVAKHSKTNVLKLPIIARLVRFGGGLLGLNLICSSLLLAQANDAVKKVVLPREFVQQGAESSNYNVNFQGRSYVTALEPEIQQHLSKFIVERGNPIAAAVVVDIKTGHIIAMVQGRSPELWNAQTHTALHSLFPAASLFKTVVAGATFDLTDLGPLSSFGLDGGCANVRPTGVWLNDDVHNVRNQMSIAKAFGQSCNGFFAKLGVNNLGLKTILHYAEQFGWNGDIDVDFDLPKSPITPPNQRSSSVHSVGRFAAGFGAVGINAVHAAWIYAALANHGKKMPLRLFLDPVSTAYESNTPVVSGSERILSESAADKMNAVMESTVRSGTAAFAFKRGKYKKFREIAGGKTGTLSGKTPEGVTTWFSGLMPMNNPRVVVAAVVVLENLWHIKAPNLAAEAFWAYDEYVLQKEQLEILPDVQPASPTSDGIRTGSLPQPAKAF